MNRTSAFLDYLNVLLEAGSPLLQAVRLTDELRPDRGWKKFVQGVASRLEDGISFPGAIQGTDPEFPASYFLQLRVAEETGGLAEACKRIVADISLKEARTAEWRRITIYPVFVLMTGLGCAWIMGSMVLPTFQELYRGMGVALPGWIGTLEWGLRFGPPLFLFTILIMVLSWRMLNQRLRSRVEILFFRLPVIGVFLRRRAFFQMLQTLSLLLRSHISLQDSLRMVAQEVTPAWKRTLRSLQQNVAAGKPFSEIVRVHQLAPGWVVAILRVGEEAGNLDEMLLRIMEKWEENERSLTRSIFSVAEPVLVAATGVGVGAFVFLVVGPMFDLLTRVSW